MAYEKIVTVYDTEEHANEAVRALKAAGFPEDDISVLNNQTLGSDGGDANPVRQSGFWGKLFGGGVREHEAEVYGRAVEQGGYVVTLRAPDTEVDRAMKILDTHKTVDVDERATSYGLNPNTSRSLAQQATSGVSRAAGAVAGAAGAVTGQVSDATARAANTARGAAAAPAGDEEVLRLAEEQLNVGKRQVEAGTTRIRRFVTERPVEEQVSLHEEHAEVMRRAVSDPNYLGDVDWSDKTIEVKEMAEEAVVSKTTRLAEEVVVRKEGSDHVETVRDKVRRQQVEVEHLDATGRPATTPPKP
ncbi:MAG: DUF2382 domain-containing protein [Acidobacteriaceae bacterium]|nr:DUF2382 domain-containing protein [Acidobacteriaceae bacterium]MBV9308941.1 DUF2382 domain-containing protein [Acidobacteriaceae bacterium]